MSRLLEWNNLQEATDYLTGETGETWTQRMVLDAGEKESFKVRFVLPPGVEAGREAEFIGDKPQLMPVSINALLNDGSVLVGWVPFTHPITRRETSLELKPRPRITLDEIRIRGVELAAFATSEKSAQQTEPPNTGKQVPSAKEVRTKGEAWSDAELKTLWEESIMPDATQASLAKNYGVTRQRIAVLLKQAKDKFRVGSQSPFATWQQQSQNIKKQ